MKASFIKLLFIFILACLSRAAFSQSPPPNDNLANATILSGTDTTFSGSLTGATLEPNELLTAFGGNPPGFSNSIWWSWTAPVSTVLNLEIDYLLPINLQDYVFIYASTNSAGSPAGLAGTMVTNVYVQNQVPHFVISVPVTAGSNYLIQLIGAASSVQYGFHLLATNTPLIFRQPASQTVSTETSTIFYVESGGLSPRTYQWFKNGANLVGETAPILAWEHIYSTLNGKYTVLISNASGSIMSDAATLTVSDSNVPPILNLIGRQAGVTAFRLAGELGRCYRIESSSDMIHWSPENSFLFSPQLGSPNNIILGSVIYYTNSTTEFCVTNNSAQQYYRVAFYKTKDAVSEICINNLRQVVIAKQLWRSEYQVSPNATPTFDDLKPYIPHPISLYCPDDGFHNPAYGISSSYIISSLTAVPVCEIHPEDHKIEGVP